MGEGEPQRNERPDAFVVGSRLERHERAEGKPASQDRQRRKSARQLVHCRMHVVSLAATVIVNAFASSHATEVEAQDREALVLESLRDPEEQLEMHHPAVQGVGVAEYRRRSRGLRWIHEHRFQTSGRASKVEGLVHLPKNTFCTMSSLMREGRAAFLLFVPVPFLFYLWTTAPGVAHADHVVLVEHIYQGLLDAGATHHNLTILIGYPFCHLLPLGDYAYRCNLASALVGALSVLVFFLAARRIAGHWGLAWVGALMLMTSHSHWWHATVAEVYAVNGLMTALILYTLVSFSATGQGRFWNAAAALAGFAVFNHVQMGFWLPALLAGALFSSRAEPRALWRAAARTSLWYAAGLLPYAVLFVRGLLRAPTVKAAMTEAVGGEFANMFFTFNASILRDTLLLFLMQWGFPSLMLFLLVPLGAHRLAARSDHRTIAVVLATGFGINTAFFAMYPTWERFAFLLPSFMILTFVGLFGLHAAWEVLAARPPLRAAFAATAVLASLYPIHFFRELPNRARRSSLWQGYAPAEVSRFTQFDGRYLANPDKSRYRDPELFAEHVSARLPQGAVLIDHLGRTFFALAYYQRHYSMRPDLALTAFIPPSMDAARWWKGISPEGAIATIGTAAAPENIFVTSLVLGGFSDVVIALGQTRQITFVEYPLGADVSIFQAKRASSLSLASWTAGASVTRDSGRPAVRLELKRRNPPVVARVEWVEAERGQKLAGRGYNLPFDTVPVLIQPETLLPPGRWTANVYLFDQLVGSVPLETR